jgi:hypothetical protein
MPPISSRRWERRRGERRGVVDADYISDGGVYQVVGKVVIRDELLHLRELVAFDEDVAVALVLGFKCRKWKETSQHKYSTENTCYTWSPLTSPQIPMPFMPWTRFLWKVRNLFAELPLPHCPEIPKDAMLWFSF